MDSDLSARNEILAKLAQSREEVRRLLDPPLEESAGNGAASLSGPGRPGFPRSRTMRMLLSSRGLGTLGALAAGLLVARPALALRLLRMVPAGAVAKLLIARAVRALKEKPANGGGAAGDRPSA
ncbi:MAG: hypothetical protein ACLPV8_00755 [Steroidobacteraceae bacterium]